MALTVREAMALGGLRRGEVLAGAGGLDRTITWVKVLESPETISWLAEGELLLTVAFAIKDDRAAQRDLMRNLAAVKSAGLVIKPERYLPEIPADMLGQADEFGIPLIRIPPDVSYLEIMNPILERIINAQNAELRRSIEIHRQFTDLAHAATVIALEMIKQREVAEAEDRVRGELVDDLLNGTFGDEANVQRRARHLRYDLSVPHRLLVVDVDHFGRFIRERRYEEGRVIALKHQLFQVVTGAVRRQHPRHLVSAHSDSVIVLVPQPADGKDPEAEALAARIREAVADSELGITVSVSIGRLCVKPDDFKPAFAEAQRALDLMVRFGKREQVINYERLGVYRLLAQVEDRAGLDAFAGRMLAPLVDYDRARGTPLLKTLEVYLQRHGNLRQSSRDLHIHLNTLHYRLRRIGEVTGLDLKDADARLDLLLALRVRALAESK